MTAEILAKVEYANLLSINWNEQKIQTNFRLIVDALNQQQFGGSELKTEVERLKEEMLKLTERVDAIPKHTCTGDSHERPHGFGSSIKPVHHEHRPEATSDLLNEF